MTSLEKATILVVDDQLDMRILSMRILENEGYQVIVAEDGFQALSILAKQHIDLIIADVAMPNLNGYQLFERIHGNPDWANLPFIMLSGRALDSDIRYGKSLGVDDYMTKPFDPHDLVASVRGRLRRAEQLAGCLDMMQTTESTVQSPIRQHDSGDAAHHAPLTIDTKRQIVNHGGCEITLSAREYRLLLFLYNNQNRVVPLQELISCTHGMRSNSEKAGQLLRPLVRSLRRKLGYQAGENSCIRNVRGIGYQYIEYG
ncbi:MAG: response regulator transcription factor [Anaerolineales bacterium]|nr:MAG: response regulator transcription factor [Anaerolineales bacterium]